MKDGLKVRGFLRIKLGEDGPDGSPRVVGDSGWVENQIVNLGWKDYVFGLMGADAGSKLVARMIIGTGGAPASGDTEISGETVRSSTINVATSGSHSLQFTTSFASGTANGDVNVAGLINDTASGGTIMCGQSFASSGWASNQALSATYMLST